MNWHNLSQTMDALDGTVMAEAYADVGSPWFSGHFPGEPILPGIAILSMVKDAIRSSETKKGRRIRISSIRRVRFKLPVRPDQLLKISLSLSCQDEGLSYHFNVESSGKAVCTGIILAHLLAKEIQLHDTFS